MKVKDLKVGSLYVLGHRNKTMHTSKINSFSPHERSSIEKGHAKIRNCGPHDATWGQAHRARRLGGPSRGRRTERVDANSIGGSGLQRSSLSEYCKQPRYDLRTFGRNNY